MKILVLSDSHSELNLMRSCVEKIKPDVIIHLGDYYQDAADIHDEYPNITLYQVPGNCDRYRCVSGAAETLIEKIDGVRFYLTHGHLQQVKWTTDVLVEDAKRVGVDAVLYGHTHHAECYHDPSGLWVMNPGSCGYYGGTAGLIETKNGAIVNCWIINQRNLEE